MLSNLTFYITSDISIKKHHTNHCIFECTRYLIQKRNEILPQF